MYEMGWVFALALYGRLFALALYGRLYALALDELPCIEVERKVSQIMRSALLPPVMRTTNPCRQDCPCLVSTRLCIIMRGGFKVSCTAVEG